MESNVIHSTVDSPLSESPVLYRPTVVINLGTSGTTQARSFLAEVIRVFGRVPEHLEVGAVDSTHQRHYENLPRLSDRRFFNLSELPKLQDQLHLAAGDPAVMAYMDVKMTRQPLGDGVGGIEPLSRWLIERNYSQLVAWFTNLVSKFQPSQRAALSRRALEDPVLRRWGASIESEGPIRILTYNPLTGGTVASLQHLIALMKRVLKKLGIEANFISLESPPARTQQMTVEDRRRSMKSFARRQEMVDRTAGKPLVWNVNGEALRDEGYPFCLTLVLPEPDPNSLYEYHCRAGREAFTLTTPLGKGVFDTAADMVNRLTAKGKHGQVQYLSLYQSTSILPTPYADPVGFVRGELGCRLNDGPTDSTADDPTAVAKAEGLEPSALDASHLNVSMPTMPPRLQDPEPFLRHAADTSRKKLNDAAKEALDTLGDRLSAVAKQLTAAVDRRLRSAGPASAAEFVAGIEAYSAKLHRSCLGAYRQLANRQFPAGTGDPRKRLEALLKKEVAAARAKFSFDAAEALERLAVKPLAALGDRVRKINEAFADSAAAHAQERRAFDFLPAAEYSIIDRPRFQELIDEVRPPFLRAAYEAAAVALDAEVDAAALRRTLEELINRAAEPWGRCRDLNEALRLAGPAGRRTIQDAVRALDPSKAVKTDALYKPDVEASRFVFSSLDHPEVIGAAGGRNTVTARGWDGDGRIQLIAIDFGVEPTTLACTQEGMQCFLDDTSETPPFSDRRYVPWADVVIPAVDEWPVWLLIPLHLHLDDGVITYDAVNRWCYRGVKIGADRKEASETLRKRQGQLPGLPTLEQISQEVERRLARFGLGAATVEVLENITDELTRELESGSPAEQLIVRLERSVVSRRLDEVREGVRREAAFREARPKTPPHVTTYESLRAPGRNGDSHVLRQD